MLDELRCVYDVRAGVGVILRVGVFLKRGFALLVNLRYQGLPGWWITIYHILPNKHSCLNKHLYPTTPSKFRNFKYRPH